MNATYMSALGSSDSVLTTALLFTMYHTQHAQLIKLSGYAYWGALIAAAVTIAVLLVGGWFVVADPTGLKFKLLLTLLGSVPFGTMSGTLFRQYNSMQKLASELIARLSQERRLSSSLALSDAINSVTARDASHADLARRLVTGSAPQVAAAGKTQAPQIQKEVLTPA